MFINNFKLQKNYTTYIVVQLHLSLYIQPGPRESNSWLNQPDRSVWSEFNNTAHMYDNKQFSICASATTKTSLTLKINLLSVFIYATWKTITILENNQVNDVILKLAQYPPQQFICDKRCTINSFKFHIRKQDGHRKKIVKMW